MNRPRGPRGWARARAVDRRLAPRLVALILAGTSAACGAVTTSSRELPPLVAAHAPAARPPRGDHGDELALYVWTRPTGSAGTEDAVTYVLDEAGTVLAREPGVLVGTSRGVLRWEVRAQRTPTLPCEATSIAAGAGQLARAALLDPATGARDEVVPLPAFEESNTRQHDARLVASVGPYLFVLEEDAVFACGAHGSTAVTARVWDAERRTAVDLVQELPALDVLARQADARLDEAGLEAAPLVDDERSAIVALVPSFGPDATLALDALGARSACYACGDGRWSSYTRAAAVPVGPLPRSLRGLGVPPRAVRAFVSGVSGESLGGWSVGPRPKRPAPTGAPSS